MLAGTREARLEFFLVLDYYPLGRLATYTQSQTTPNALLKNYFIDTLDKIRS